MEQEELHITQIKGEIVQIILKNDEFTPEGLDVNSLRTVFSTVEDKPIAIYCIDGLPDRNSILLNLFFQYLSNAKISNNQQWFKDQQTVLETVSGYNKMSLPNRNSLCMWNKPFTRQCGSSEIAVFVMWRIKGHPSSQDGSLAIALSSLLSSVLIHNTLSQINLVDLHQLQLRTKCEKLTKRQPEDFVQELMFLVRDWPDPEYEYGPDGGIRMLGQLFDTENVSIEMKEIQKDIKSSFENISCFLLPHPGQGVVRRKIVEDGPMVQDFDEEFIHHIDQLLCKLFDDKNLVVKKIGDKPATGKLLLQLATEVAELFQQANLIHVGSGFTEVNASDKIKEVVMNLTKEYSNKMKEVASKGILEPEELNSYHDQLKHEAIDMYNAFPKLGSTDLIINHEKEMIDIINSYWAHYQNLNAMKQTEVRKFLNEVVENLVAAYSKELSDLYGETYVNTLTMQSLESNIPHKLGKFDKISNEYPENYVVEYKEKLTNLLNLQFGKFKTANTSKKEEQCRQLQSVSAQALYMFMENVDVDHQGKEDNIFLRGLNSVKEKAMAEFDSYNVGIGTEHRKQIRDTLEVKINNEEKQFSTFNKLNRIKHNLQHRSETLLKEYEQDMEKCLEDYPEDDTLFYVHNKLKLLATEKFQSDSPEATKDEVGYCIEQLKIKIEKQHELFKAKNIKKRNKLQAKLDTILEKYLVEHQDHLEKFANDHSLEEVQKEHEAVKNRKMQDYLQEFGDSGLLRKLLADFDCKLEDRFEELKQHRQKFWGIPNFFKRFFVGSSCFFIAIFATIVARLWFNE